MSRQQLVRIIVDDDGAPTNNDAWHLVDPMHKGATATLCTGEVFGAGESIVVVYETRTVLRGGITCAECLKKLRIYKAVKI